MFESLINSLAVTAVFLVDYFDDIRIFGRVGIGDGAGLDQLEPSSTMMISTRSPPVSKGVDADVHIGGGIVTGNGK